ncbi:hypothetical protein PGB90_009593 [Kerria lacca]
MNYHYSSSSKKDDENSCCGGSVWFVKDICGIICACLTWLLMLYAEFVVLFVILLPNSRLFYRCLNTIVFQTFTIFALISHLRTMFTDPGAVPKGNACIDTFTPDGLRNGQLVFKCPKCCSFKPERAHHCSVCQRCIRKMDHHCPWVNNCVGENNQKYFILFTFYITIISSHALFLSVNQFITCIHSDWRECSAFSPPATIIMILFLVFEALLFAIFTLVMFITQLQAIWIDETGIEQLKKEEARWKKTSRWKSLQTVFGRFSLAWFSPFTLPPSKSKLNHYLYSV